MNPTRTRDATFGEARARSETTTKVFVHVLVACLPPFQRSRALTTRSRGEMFARSRAATRSTPRAVGEDARRRRRRERRRDATAAGDGREIRTTHARERDYPPHPIHACASAAHPSRTRRRRRARGTHNRVPSRPIAHPSTARARLSTTPRARFRRSIDRESIDRAPSVARGRSGGARAPGAFVYTIARHARRILVCSAAYTHRASLLT
jgi:hypothetical protein